MNSIAFVGAGITSLSAAYLIKKYYPNHYNIFIIDKEIGGKIKTKLLEFNNNKYFVELGPDSLVYNEKFIEINNEFQLDKLYPIFFNNNPNYVFFDNKIYKIPNNMIDFLFSNLISFKSKLVFLFNLFRKISYSSNDTLLTFCQRNFTKEFNENILFPIFSNVFSTDIDKLSIIPLLPYLKNIKKNLLKNKTTIFFNFKQGLQSLVDYFYQFLVNNNVKFINGHLINFKFDKEKYILKTENMELSVNKIFFCTPAFDLSNIINNSLNNFENSNENFVELLRELLNLLKNISYHSSFIYILILNNFFNLKINGLLFKDHQIFKAISFFNKKWNNLIQNLKSYNNSYDKNEYNKSIEFLRIFFKDDFSFAIKELIVELKKINIFKNIKLDNVIYSEYIKWENSILTNDINLFKVSRNIELVSQKLRDYNIYILANFIKGSSIVDRLYNSIEFIKTNFKN